MKTKTNNVTNEYVGKNYNNWLIDKDFIRGHIDYSDTAFLDVLFSNIYNYIKRCPVPVITNFDPVNIRVYFYVGEIKVGHISVVNDMTYTDHIVIMNRYLRDYFPSFSCKYTYNRPYTPDEIADKIKAGTKINIDNIFNEMITTTRTDEGQIEKNNDARRYFYIQKKWPGHRKNIWFDK